MAELPVTSRVRCCADGGGGAVVLHAGATQQLAQPTMWNRRRERVILPPARGKPHPGHGPAVASVSFCVACANLGALLPSCS